jgi:prepilin-type N-terminal cleavage/methylation domain-containing protein
MNRFTRGLVPRSANRNPRQKWGEGGFTLLEIIISMAILVLGLSTILPLFAVGTTSHKRGIDQTMVSLIAPHITARLQERLYEMNPQPLKDQEYAEVGRVYKYDATFTPLDRDDALRMAFIVRVTVRWDENAAQHSETFSTILLRRTPR